MVMLVFHFIRDNRWAITCHKFNVEDLLQTFTPYILGPGAMGALTNLKVVTTFA